MAWQAGSRRWVMQQAEGSRQAGAQRKPPSTTRLSEKSVFGGKTPPSEPRITAVWKPRGLVGSDSKRTTGESTQCFSLLLPLSSLTETTNPPAARDVFLQKPRTSAELVSPRKPYRSAISML